MPIDLCALLFPDHSFPCDLGYGMCVSRKHGLVIISCYEEGGGSKLDIFSLYDGVFVRSIGEKGKRDGELLFDIGGLCISPDDDSVLVAESYKNRVKIVRLVDGVCLRVVGEGVLDEPQYVDCNTEVIVVVESRPYISVFKWVDGSVLSRFRMDGGVPTEGIIFYRASLLCSGRGVVLADDGNRRLSVFSVHGKLIKTVGILASLSYWIRDVQEDEFSGDYLCSAFPLDTIARISASGDNQEIGRFPFDGPVSITRLLMGGLAVRCAHAVHVFKGVQLRFAWLEGCARLAAARDMPLAETNKKARSV